MHSSTKLAIVNANRLHNITPYENYMHLIYINRLRMETKYTDCIFYPARDTFSSNSNNRITRHNYDGVRVEGSLLMLWYTQLCSITTCHILIIKWWCLPNRGSVICHTLVILTAQVLVELTIFSIWGNFINNFSISYSNIT